jgi:hypothetical protein
MVLRPNSAHQEVLHVFDARVGGNLHRTADEMFNGSGTHEGWETFWNQMNSISQGALNSAMPNPYRYQPLIVCRKKLEELLHLS